MVKLTGGRDRSFIWFGPRVSKQKSQFRFQHLQGFSSKTPRARTTHDLAGGHPNLFPTVLYDSKVAFLDFVAALLSHYTIFLYFCTHSHDNARVCRAPWETDRPAFREPPQSTLSIA